jgi:hypothetical protein
MSQTKQLDPLTNEKCMDMKYILDKWHDDDNAVSDNINRLKEEFWAFYYAKYPGFFAVTPVASSIAVIPCGTEGGVHIGLRFSARGVDRKNYYSSDVDDDTDFQVYVNLNTGETFILYLTGGGCDGRIMMTDLLDTEWMMFPIMFGVRREMEFGEDAEEDDEEGVLVV